MTRSDSVIEKALLHIKFILQCFFFFPQYIWYILINLCPNTILKMEYIQYYISMYIYSNGLPTQLRMGSHSPTRDATVLCLYY